MVWTKFFGSAVRVYLIGNNDVDDVLPTRGAGFEESMEEVEFGGVIREIAGR